jgi:uncharacterized protein
VSTLAVHVTPKSGRDEVVGWKGSELSVRVTAAPEGGKATAAVCAVIAKRLGVPKTSVRVLRGDVSRHKVLDIPTADQAMLVAEFGCPDESLF